ncbi:alpha-galactosidase [Neiella sp. HB171785]|uniref:Alpha-galactosidase n=1 Tax=Neiella litorisoli TaxID=2771431 RepID=A0A8J6UIM5_9GAMM|nr:glycoside hydrolase family 36 protein [Neiella litorisoli]MBD1388608.1 alpha-galactosidase [Neiella litorisoli]
MPIQPPQSTLATPCFDRRSTGQLILSDNCVVVRANGAAISQLQDVIVASWDLSLWQDLPVLGDGYQMLCQWRGTLRQPQQVSRCADNDRDYRRYSPEQVRYYNYLIVEIEPNQAYWLCGFPQCQQFNGYFEYRQSGLLVAVVETEQMTLQCNEEFVLPMPVCFSGVSISDVTSQFAAAIQQHHGQPRFTESVKGWCSWYHYYEHITTDIIAANSQALNEQFPQADVVLIDDGYQQAMGDWLVPSDKFAGGVESAISAIKQANCRPGIWLAPFIAEQSSQLLQQHPDWFVRDQHGELLRADDITYGGWRCTPWYLLDTSQDGPCQYLKQTVATMRKRWGIVLFKLDALYWGALNVARAQPMTSVAAYRRGLAAIQEGAGDAMVLGCNAPMWPSLGLVDAMRTSDDIHRHMHRFHQLHQENAARSWQHQKLWLLDQDCVTLADLNTPYQQQQASHDEYLFHATSILAHGGNLMLGDAMLDIPPLQRSMIERLLTRWQYSERSADYRDLNFNQAHLQLNQECDLYLLFNPQREVALSYRLAQPQAVDWFDFWQQMPLADQQREFTCEVGPHQARAILTKKRV